jgi:hypothetical protein
MMHQRIETYNAYSKISTTGDVIVLLKIIKGINYNFQSQKHVPVSLHKAKHQFYGYCQTRYQSFQAYMENSKIMLMSLHTLGSIGPGLSMFAYATEELGKDVSELNEQAKETARN